MKPNTQLEDAIVEQRTHRKRCPDYDAECKEVRCPLACYLGDEHLGRAEGYCPLLLGIPESSQ